MKTTIIKTDVWKDDDFFSLHMDSKIAYLFMLSSPERGTINIFKWSLRMASAYTGIEQNQLQRGVDELCEGKFIVIYQGYVMLLRDHLAKNGGRYASINESRELDSIPPNVLTYFKKCLNDGPIVETKELIEIKNAEIKKTYTPEDEHLGNLLFDKINEMRPDQTSAKLEPKKSDYDALRLMRERDKIPIERMETIIQMLPSIPFWGEKYIIRSGGSFRKHWQELVAGARELYNKAQKNRVVEI